MSVPYFISSSFLVHTLLYFFNFIHGRKQFYFLIWPWPSLSGYLYLILLCGEKSKSPPLQLYKWINNRKRRKEKKFQKVQSIFFFLRSFLTPIGYYIEFVHSSGQYFVKVFMTRGSLFWTVDRGFELLQICTHYYGY